MVRRLVTIYFLFFAFGAIGCVSVELNKSKPAVRNGDVKFTAPARPFEEIKSNDLDRGWRHIKNGNSISFITECQDGIDPTLENIYNGILKNVSQVEALSKNTMSYNGREALRAVVTGNVDGVLSKIDFVIFKKNGCTHILTYVALASNFDASAGDFQKFIDGYKAP